MDTDYLKRTTAAVIGALIFTSACVGAAVGPARALETAPAAQVSGQARA